MKEIYVFADWIELTKPTLMGILRSEVSKGEEVFSFEYTSEWLKSGFAHIIDPDLKLYQGPQYLLDDKPNFGLFLDSSPDRWGRMLMNRRKAILDRGSNRKAILHESDYLLGVHDESRMGALRYKLDLNGEFLEHDNVVKAPPFTSIRELEQISLKFESDDFFNSDDEKRWLKLLIAPGSSLGGARPKASVRHTDGSLWIAKFPSKSDHKDSGLWEFLASEIGRKLEINMSMSNASRFSQRHHTFLTKRFDRGNQDERIHFSSAMTLLGYKDGTNHKDGVSYIDIARLIDRYGADPKRDLNELWKRIVFSVAISNTDDHLRNHGFLLSPSGWSLSPAYDINPNENGLGLTLNISEYDNSLDYELCLTVIDYFRMDLEEAKNFVQMCKKEVSKWTILADSYKISNREKDLMSTAFRY